MTTSFRNRRAFLLYVDLDPVPGAFHTAGLAQKKIEDILENRISHYSPSVIFANERPRGIDGSERTRACFYVTVDLDPVPGAFHSQESAHNSLRGIFRDAFGNYKPMVSLAPESIQPATLITALERIANL